MCFLETQMKPKKFQPDISFSLRNVAKIKSYKNNFAVPFPVMMIL